MDSVNAYYQLADLFICSSTSEAQGLTYFEALANGVPALCKKDACLDGVLIKTTKMVFNIQTKMILQSF